MIIRRQLLARRTVLRGMGTAMALPFMEAMAPNARAADAAARPRRLSVFYTPNGMMMEQFKPAATGKDYKLPSTLEPLAAFRDRMTVVSGLGHPQAAPMGDLNAGHGRSCPAFLTGTHVRQTEGTDIRCAVSVDQVYARHLGDATQLPSLETGIDQPSLLGSCDIGYSCAYTNGLSWMSPTVPLPVAANPRDVFERLFGDGDALDAQSRMAQMRRQTSILDFVREDAARLDTQLGAEDRAKLDEYLTATRDIEKRIQRAASTPLADAGAMQRPSGIPDSFDAHVKLMVDLQVLAFQADITRVATFMTGREISNRTYPEIGVPDSHHMLSHHGHMEEKKIKLAAINRHHMTYYAYLLQRLAETKDGDASLLDRSFVLRGSAFGDPNEHDYMDLPVVVAGGLVRHEGHVAVAKGTPMSNLLLTGLNALGVPDTRFGDSTGALREVALRKTALAALLLGLGSPALAAPPSDADLALARAITLDDVAGARAALADHAAPDRRLDYGATPLMQAVDRQDQALVALLLGAGADANLADEQGLSPLTLACQLGGEAVLDHLLLAPHIAVRTALPDGASALHVCARYAPAAMVARLLTAGALPDAPDSRGQTPLMWAAMGGKTDSIALLLKAGAKVNAVTQAGFTPLFFAIKSGTPEASAALIAAGADTAHRGPKNTNALQLALYQQNWAAAVQLATRLPDHSPLLTERDDQGLQPLNAAAIGGDPALVTLLLAKEADANALSGPSSVTWVTEANFGMPPPPVPPTPPLLLAAQHGNAQAMKLLIAGGADPKFIAADGTTLVIGAAQGGQVDALALAIAAGPDVNQADASGDTALHVLAGGGYSAQLAPMLALLHQHGARADLPDKKGHTPAMLADAALKEVKTAFTTTYPTAVAMAGAH